MGTNKATYEEGGTGKQDNQGYALKIRAVTKTKSGEVDLTKTVRREALAKEAPPEIASVLRQVSLAGSGNNKDDEGVL